MAVRNDFAAGEVLAAQDLDDTFAAKANLASPTFTGTPAAPTAAAGTDTTQIATTAFVQAASGLRLITTQSFSAVSSVSLNNCFSADYGNYRILIETAASDAGPSFYMRVRASGTDNTTANSYVRQSLVGNATTASANRETSTLWNIGAVSSTIRNNFSIDVFSPFLAQATTFTDINMYGSSSAFLVIQGGSHNQNTSYDGCTFSVQTGTVTGSVSVYGYRK